MSSPLAAVEIYHGNAPYSMMNVMYNMLFAQAHCFYSSPLAVQEEYECSRAKRQILEHMHKQNSDDTVAHVPNDLRIMAVDDAVCQDNVDVNYTSVVCYDADMYVVKLARSKLPQTVADGHYKCALRMEVGQGFWNRSNHAEHNYNVLMAVPCKLSLHVLLRSGPLVPRPPPYIHPWRRYMNYLVKDFREAFLLEEPLQ